MDATTWGLALLGIGLIITVAAATRVGSVSTALFAVGLSAMLAGTMLLDMVRRG
ncbi:MAG TPA: hypothetical protein VK869_03445 [Rubrobacteraceae bacterium]|nr:hypothetical protein [Rubrobacteraceae bacterium]